MGRKVQGLRLIQHYHGDEDFKLFCDMMDGVAFMPLQEVEDDLAYLRGIAPDEANELLDYFDRTFWITLIAEHRLQLPRAGAEWWRTHTQRMWRLEQ